MMPRLDWLTDYINLAFPQLFDPRTMDVSTVATTSSRTQTQSTPTLSFDLSAPTDPSSGWTVKKVWGADGDNSNDFAKQLQDILNRTETYSILNTLFCRHVVAFLTIVWSMVLWRKLRAVGMKFGRLDGLAVVVCVVSVIWRDMVIAIGVTAGYVAWAVLADRPWNGKGGLPGFEAFVKGLTPAGNDEDTQGAEQETETHAVAPTAEQGAGETEAALLTKLEASLGLPEKKPHEDCVVCWSSSSEDEPPLCLPCSHLVCADCLARLKDANRYTCPFCRRPLYALATNKVALFQLVAACSGAQLVLALILTALRIARGRYWGAAECLVLKAWPAAGALWQQWGIRTKGEEGYFASTSERFLGMQLGLSFYILKGIYRGLDKVGWATFVDGKLVRAGVDEWREVREVVCWVVTGLVGKMVSC